MLIDATAPLTDPSSPAPTIEGTAAPPTPVPPPPEPSTPIPATSRYRKRGRGRWYGHVKGSGASRADTPTTTARSGTSSNNPANATGKEVTWGGHGSGESEFDGLLPANAKYMDQEARIAWIEGIEQKKTKELYKGIGASSWW